MTEVGRFIRQVRDERGLSRRELSDATGLSYPYLQQVEAGARRPSSKTLALVAQALGLPLERLLALSGDHAELAREFTTGGQHFAMAAAAPPPEPDVDAVVEELLSVLRRLPPRARAEALGRLVARVTRA